jgi:hypothetical protein
MTMRLRYGSRIPRYPVRTTAPTRLPTSQAALVLAPGNIDFLMRRVLKGGEGDYLAALLLAEVDLPEEAMSKFATQAEVSDCIAIVIRSKQWRQATPYLLKRLQENPTGFDYNTLAAIIDFGDASSLPVVKLFLQTRQAAIPFSPTEELACEALLTLPGGGQDADVVPLINRSWDRFCLAVTTQWKLPFLLYYFDTATTMIQNLIMLWDARGLVEAAKLIETLDSSESVLESTSDRLDPAIEREISQERERGLESLQSIVNQYLPDEMKFSYLDDSTQRKTRIDQMSRYFGSFTFP